MGARTPKASASERVVHAERRSLRDRFASLRNVPPFLRLVFHVSPPLVLAQAIRLASMNSTARFLQMQMSAPDMISVAEFTEQPMKNLGALEWTLR